jgi:hypothetical protein
MLLRGLLIWKTPVTRLRLCESAIAARVVSSRKILGPSTFVELAAMDAEEPPKHNLFFISRANAE